jgi:hypothetical protein
MDLAVQVSAEMIGVGNDLTVRAIWGQALEVLDLQWLIRGPWGSGNSERDGQIKEFHHRLLLDFNYCSPCDVMCGDIS